MPTIQRFQSVLSDFGQRLPLNHQGDFQKDSVMTAIAKLERTMRSGRQVDGFRIEILLPGASLDNGDSGIGAIGRIDHARVTPGTVIHMHPHKDDEILTYLRRGQVMHHDTVGHDEILSNQRMMLMNAGHSFQHEETVLPEGGVLEGLQIFMRLSAPDLGSSAASVQVALRLIE